MRIIQPFIDAIHGFSRHENTMMAAGIAYYLALSFFPLLLVLAAVLGYAMAWTDVGQDAQSQLLETISDQASPQLSSQVERALTAVTKEAPAVGTFGFALLVFTAIAMFAQLDYAFDRIWSLPSDQPLGWLHWIGRLVLTRLKALVMLFGVGAFVLAATIASTVWAGTEARIAEYVAIAPLMQAWARVGLNLLLNMSAFAALYRFMPRRRVRLRNALAGGFVAAVLWEGGRQLLAWYLLRENYPTAYGVIGSFMAIMLWAYYATLVVLYGAEFTRAMSGHGTIYPPVAPSSHAN